MNLFGKNLDIEKRTYSWSLTLIGDGSIFSVNLIIRKGCML